MSYIVDKSLSWDGLYQFQSDSGCNYIIKIKKVSEDSSLWTIELIRKSGEPPVSEIFKTMKTIADICKEYMNIVKGNRVIMLISGNYEESLQKANVFTRYMKDEWNYNIDIPTIKLPGLRSPNVNTTNFMITATRKKDLIEINKSEMNSTISNVDIKFCFNCGTPNNNFVFCPGCGTKLKQA